MSSIISQDIIMIIDESGSMTSMGSEPLQAINSFIKEQQNCIYGDNSNFTLWKFNTKVSLAIDNQPLKNIPEFTDFNPQGLTALNDAIGMAIDNNISDNVICVIVTDGFENASNLYSLDFIKTQIFNKEQNNNWKFVYLGANQDAFTIGKNIGLHPKRCSTFSSEENHNIGLLNISKQLSQDIKVYRQLSSQGEKNIDLTLSQPILENNIIPPPIVRTTNCIPPPIVRTNSCLPPPIVRM